MSTQVTREELADMTPEQIVTAKREGRLNSLLGRAVVGDGELTREDLDGMSPADIVSAKRAGRLDALLGH
ncbi:hypothetical protein [Streptomyces sp. NPDC001999]